MEVQKKIKIVAWIQIAKFGKVSGMPLLDHIYYGARQTFFYVLKYVYNFLLFLTFRL